MAIVTRNGNIYAYKSVRVNGKVTSRYIGSGEFGMLLNEMDRLNRLEKRNARNLATADFAAEKRRHARRERKAVRADDAVDGILASLLIAAGFHKPNRGEWRKRRERQDTD